MDFPSPSLNLSVQALMGVFSPSSPSAHPPIPLDSYHTMPKSHRPQRLFLGVFSSGNNGYADKHKQSSAVRAKPRPLSTTEFKSRTQSQCGFVSCQISFRPLRQSSRPAILISRMKPTLTASKIYIPITIFDPGSIASDFGHPSEAVHRLHLARNHDSTTPSSAHVSEAEARNVPVICLGQVNSPHSTGFAVLTWQKRRASTVLRWVEEI